MRSVFAAMIAICLAGSSVAQDDRAQSLADIRQELTILFVELQRLKQELNTTGTVGGTGTQGSIPDRVAAIESEMQRLTAKTEQLEFRIDSIVRDGTNRIGDLEFRLVELEGGDISKLGDTPTLGGGELPQAAVQAPQTSQTASEGPQLAIGEEADFKAAQDALADGDYETAVSLYETFNQTYPGGPLSAAADLGRGVALEGMGQIRDAARAYLAAFTADQTGPTAPDALYRLGASLGDLGQVNEACVTLGEVGLRFPGANAVADAQAEMQAIGCS